MTLIDVLVAMGLLSLGGAGLLAVELSVVAASARTRALSAATCLAKAQMERLVYATVVPSSGNDTVDALGCGGTRGCVQQGTIFTRTWTVGAGSPAALQVVVSFAAPSGRQHGVVLHGLR